MFCHCMDCVSSMQASASGSTPFCPCWDRMMTVRLAVCTTCRAGEIVPEGAALPGAVLHAALTRGPVPDGVRIAAVACLSACSNGCAIALSGPGRWSYVYGQMGEADAADILAGAKAYAAAPDGIVPWRERPLIFRKRSLARVPPMEL